MPSCLKPAVLSTSTGNNFMSSSQGGSADNTPTSSVQLSPTVNLAQEYALALQTNSYSELRRTFNQDNSSDQIVEIRHLDVQEVPGLLGQVLRPGHESVQEALSLIGSHSLSKLIATYFEYSAHTSHLCLLLYQSIHRARIFYAPIHKLLDDLSLEFESLSLYQCGLAFKMFLELDRLENPFLSSDSESFGDMMKHFSQLKRQLNQHHRKSWSKVNLLCRCLREMVHLPLIDAAARGVYVLYNDLDTIAYLVARLHAAVEADKLLIRFGLERGVDRHPIQEVLKLLQRSRPTFAQHLVEFEQHLLLYFVAVNRSRLQLLQEIQMHHNQA